MRILLTTLLLCCFIGFAKAQAPTAQVLLNAYRCRSEDCVNKALSAINYVRVKPDSISKYGHTIFIYKSSLPIAGEENNIRIYDKSYNVVYITKSKANFELLMKEFKGLGFEEQRTQMEIKNTDGETFDSWVLGIPGDYTIFLRIDYSKKTGEYTFVLSIPR